MKLIEYRIFMPLTVEENQIGQLWSFAEVSRINTSGGEGVEIVNNEVFDLPLGNDGRISYKSLPEYEDHHDVSSKSKSKSSSNSMFKKSSSKENFNNKRNYDFAERSKSLEIPDEEIDNEQSDEFQSVHNNDFSLMNENDLKDKNIPIKQGQYTHKIYKIASKFPWFVRKLLPKDSTILHEKSWNMYPVIKTVVTNDYFKQNFRIEFDTIVKACVNGQAEENVHNLTPEQLQKREIIVIDISDQLASGVYKKDEDPRLFKSVKTGRGPLTPGWINKEQQPLICCYKLVALEFKVFGLQTKAENHLRSMYKQLFHIFHRQIFCWIDKWHDLTLSDVRKIEQELAKLLIKKIDEGEISKCELNYADAE